MQQNVIALQKAEDALMQRCGPELLYVQDFQEIKTTWRNIRFTLLKPDETGKNEADNCGLNEATTLLLSVVLLLIAGAFG